MGSTKNAGNNGKNLIAQKKPEESVDAFIFEGVCETRQSSQKPGFQNN